MITMMLCNVVCYIHKYMSPVLIIEDRSKLGERRHRVNGAE